MVASLIGVAGLTVIGVVPAGAVLTPAVTSVTPNSGPTAGGTVVTLSGSRFGQGVTAVTFGSTPATSFQSTFNSVTATSPAGAAGTVDVLVTTSRGTSPASVGDEFTYVAPPPPPPPAPTVTAVAPSSGSVSGGTIVKVTGTHLTGATAVTFGTTAATSFTVTSATSISATSPAGGVAGTVHVAVTTPSGVSSQSAADDFTYQALGAAPVVTGISPSTGPTTGGTPVTISGTGFTGATSVKFGANVATGVAANSSTSIGATSPVGGSGTVDVTVTTPSGTSSLSTADRFTYTSGPPPSVITIADGNAGYTPGGSEPPNQFNVLTLVTGGAGAVNPASLTIVTQPASGAATAASDGIITYTPGGATGTQTLTFAYCLPTFTYPNPAKCSTATMTYTPSADQTVGAFVLSAQGALQDIQTAVTLPATALPGATVTMTAAPAATTLPSVDSGFTIDTVGQFSTIMPVPNGFTYVPGSLGVTGGDSTTSGNYVATFCTAPAAGACSANLGGGSYKTGYPYIETTLSPTVLPAGGSNITLPTVTAQFVASGPVGTRVSATISEYQLTISVALAAPPAPPLAIVFDGYPSCANCDPVKTVAPAYANPTRLATTVIGAPGTVGSLPFSDDNAYLAAASDGGVFAYGDANFFGSMGGHPLNAPIVGMTETADQGGYWLVASDGGIFAFGDANFFGSMGGQHLNKPIVGIAATPDQNGYWLVASDGGIFAFGDATYFGSMGGSHLNKPIVGIAATSTGNGYWLVASDGGIFAFGDAGFHGSMGNMPLNKPIVGIAATSSDNGYWLVASDGGIFALGDATFYGSTGGMKLNGPIVGMQSTSTDSGYRLEGSDGGIFTFGDANFLGSAGNLPLNAPIVAIAP